MSSHHSIYYHHKRRAGNGTSARLSDFCEYYRNGRRCQNGRNCRHSHGEQPMIGFDSSDISSLATSAYIPPPRRYRSPHDTLPSPLHYVPRSDSSEEVHTGRIEVSVLFKQKPLPSVIGSERAAALEAKRRVSMELKNAVMRRLGQESPNTPLTPPTPNGGMTWTFELPEIKNSDDFGQINLSNGWARDPMAPHVDLLTSMNKLSV